MAWSVYIDRTAPDNGYKREIILLIKEDRYNNQGEREGKCSPPGGFLKKGIFGKSERKPGGRQKTKRKYPQNTARASYKWAYQKTNSTQPRLSRIRPPYPQ
jgi:hypothetical protein